MTSNSSHRERRVDSVLCAVLTVSDTRTPETDTSGGLLRERLESAGHRVVAYEVVPDEPAMFREVVAALFERADCQAVLLPGGTGLAPRDTTYEAVSGLFEKHLDGFGELFRMLSYEEIGAAAMLSRATAGVVGSTVVYSMPGSTAAVQLAMDKLILPELGHVAALLGDR